ncbi:MAG TPA: beta-eliminating lyase-related protein [Gaiellaceae bacterium]
MSDERDLDAVWAACKRTIFGSTAAARDPRALLRALAERAPGPNGADRYGGGELAERLEARVAGLLGTEAAVWLPSGTMAQQIALRIHAAHSGRNAVAFHPHCHLDVHEERGYEVLHGLHAVLLADRSRLIEPADVEGLREPVAALLLELPQRDLGGRLPAWDDLVATCEAARARGAALHLDGARLWQCTPFYKRTLAEIAGLFDTVYVSFYKDLGAPAGCALAGPRDVIDEARIWQVRHGGRLFNAYPYLLAAERGLDEVLPRLDAYAVRARELATALTSVEGISVEPDPPQTAMFHALARLPLDALKQALLDVAEESGVWCGSPFSATSDPSVQRTELTVTEESFAVPVDEARELWSAVVRKAASAAG